MGEGEEKKEIKEGIKSNSPIGKQSFSLPQKKKGKKKEIPSRKKMAKIK